MASEVVPVPIAATTHAKGRDHPFSAESKSLSVKPGDEMNLAVWIFDSPESSFLPVARVNGVVTRVMGIVETTVLLSFSAIHSCDSRHSLS